MTKQALFLSFFGYLSRKLQITQKIVDKALTTWLRKVWF
ncbi:hypothetical protein AVDCRST_MAG94-1365, partial [uncultured Leptolyngbya sp.]